MKNWPVTVLIITLLGGLWIISQAPKVDRSGFIRQRQRFPGQARPYALPNRDLFTAQTSASTLSKLSSANINNEATMWEYYNNARPKVMDALGTQYVNQHVVNLLPCFQEWSRPPGRVNFSGDQDGSTGKALINWSIKTGTLDAISAIKKDEKLTDTEKDTRINGLIRSFCDDLLKISTSDITKFQEKITAWVNKVYNDFVPVQPKAETATAAAAATAAVTPAAAPTAAPAAPVAPAVPAAPKELVPASIVAKGPLKLNSSGDEVRQLNELLVKMGLPATEELKKDIEKNSAIPKYNINYTKATEKAVGQLQAFLMQEDKKKGKDSPAALKQLTKATKGKPTGQFGKVTRDAWDAWLTDYLKAQTAKKS